jgi:hypothetical protein
MKNSSDQKVALWIIFIFSILSGLGLWQSKNFEIDASSETLLLKDNHHYKVFKESMECFQPDEFILIAFKPKKEDLFSSELLSRIDRLGRSIEEIDRVSSVVSIANSPIFFGSEDITSGIDTAALSWRSKKYSKEFMNRALKDHPLYEGLLFNEERDALALQVVFKRNNSIANLSEEIEKLEKAKSDQVLDGVGQKELEKKKSRLAQLNKELEKKRTEEIEQVRKKIKEYSKWGDFYLGGENLLAESLISIIKFDLIIFGAAITLLVGLVLFLIFRRWQWVVIPLFCCALSVVCTLGLLGLLGLKATVVSANVIALQIILVLAMMIHIMEQIREFLGDQKEGQSSVVWRAVKAKSKPCIFAGLTTAIGFGSLVFSGIQPIISFGWMMVICMVVALIVSLILFPAILVLALPRLEEMKHPRIIEKLVGGLSRLVISRSKLILTVGIAVVIGSGLGCFRLDAENSFINYFKSSTETYRELSFIDREFGGTTAFDVLYNIPSDLQDRELEITAKAIGRVAKIHDHLAKQEPVGTVTSLIDFTRIAQVVRGKPMTEYELTGFLRILSPELQKDLVEPYFSKSAEQVRISARIQDTTDGLRRQEFVQNFKEDLGSLGFSEGDYQLTNLFILYQDILARLVDSQIESLAIVYSAMGLILLIIFRSLKLALIALVPNLIGTVVVMGAMGWLGIPLDLMTITIAAVAMGISMDDTIHYIHRFQQEKLNGVEDLITTTHESVGYALVYTSLVIAGGFVALVFSDFVPTILFGALTSFSMMTALVTDLTVLPALLKATNT